MNAPDVYEFGRNSEIKRHGFTYDAGRGRGVSALIRVIGGQRFVGDKFRFAGRSSGFLSAGRRIQKIAGFIGVFVNL